MNNDRFQSSKLFNTNYNYPEGKDLTINRGGSSSGKTYTVMTVILTKCIKEPGITVTVVGQDIPNLKKGAIRDTELILNNTPQLRQWIRSYNLSDRIYKFKNGSKIEFTSYDNEQDAKNGKRDYLFCNEVNGISEGIFEALYIRTKKHTWVDFNPSAEFWLSLKKYEERPTSRVIISTFKNNPFLDKTVRNKILAYEPTKENINAGTADTYRWKVYGLGQYAALEGAIYKNWRSGQWPEDKELTIIHGLDWGFTDPFSLIEVGIDEPTKQIYVRQKVYQTELIKWRKAVSDNVRVGQVIVCDSAVPGNIHELRMDNHEAYGAWKGKGSILKGITWLQGYSIVVCNSPDIEHELNNYEWAVKENTPIDKYNHALDSIRYAVSWYKMNIVRE